MLVGEERFGEEEASMARLQCAAGLAIDDSKDGRHVIAAQCNRSQVPRQDSRLAHLVHRGCQGCDETRYEPGDLDWRR